jgi:hypothetical protein
VRLKARSANLFWLGDAFYRTGDHLGYSGCDFIERGEDILGAMPNQVKSWVQVIKMNYLPR